MTEIELDPNLLVTLQTLQSHAVEYVLIGEVADAIHNGGGSIAAVAIVPGGYGRNVDRLAGALKRLGAHLASGQPIDARVTDLRRLSPCTLSTRYADVELDFVPAGTNGYPDLFDDAARTRLAAGASPHVASPADLDRIEGASGYTRGAPEAVAPIQLPPDAVPESWLDDEVPPARAPAALPPEPAGLEDDVPPARAPAALPPEPASDWPDEIRASRATRR